MAARARFHSVRPRTRRLKLGANPRYVYSLAVIAALIAIVTVPVSVAAVSALVHRDVSVSPGQVASVITLGFLAPLLAGMVARYLWPTLAERIGEPLITTAGIVLLILGLLIVAVNFFAIVGIGLPALMLMVVMTLAALAIGHVLGGSSPNDRTTLALACATRSPALGLLVASLTFPNAKPLPDRGGLPGSRQPGRNPVSALARAADPLTRRVPW